MLKRFTEEALRVLKIPSVSADGNEELANVLAGMLQERGMSAQLQLVTHSLEDASKRQFNVIGVLGDPLVDRKVRKGLMLLSPIDTSDGGLPELWTETAGDPRIPGIKDGRMVGLGAASGKLDFMCKLFAIEKFREKKLRMPIYLVGTCGEELGGLGARYLIKSLTLNPRFSVVGDPTELKIGVAQKTHAGYRVTVGFQQVERDVRGFNRRIDLKSFGRTSHAAFPQLGVNAIEQALAILKLAMDQGFEARFTQIQGGDAYARVPDRASVQFFLASHQFEDFKRFFRDYARSEGKERAFRVELGGVGDAGVRFLPDAVFHCLGAVREFFRDLALEFETLKDDSFRPPASTASFSRVQPKLGGIELDFDLRLLPGVPAEEVDRQVREGIARLAEGYPVLNLSAQRRVYQEGLDLPAESDLLRIATGAAEAARIEPALTKRSATNAAALLQKAGFEALVFGPGRAEGHLRSPNESVSVEQLEQATAYYESLIQRVCV